MASGKDLFDAAGREDFEEVRNIIDRGGRISWQNEEGYTTLCCRERPYESGGSTDIKRG